MTKDVAAETVSNEVVIPAEAMDDSAAPRAAKDVVAMIRDMSNGEVTVYSTITGEDYETKKLTLNALTNAVPLADNLRKPFNLTNFVCEMITLTDEKTGVPFDALRTILLTAQGEAYYAISEILFKDLQRYTAILGHPSEWPEGGVAVIVDEVRNGKNRFYKMTLA